MTHQQKEDAIRKFCDWLSDNATDNLCREPERKQSLDDYLYDYCNQLDNDDTFEDEYETYETMANHVPEVINFLNNFLQFKGE